GYRLIDTVRLDPATPVYKLTASTPKTIGSGSKKQLVLPVKNAGNTVVPVTGDITISGALGSRSGDVGSLRILPGKTVDVLLATVKNLKAGSYTAKVTLKQGTTTTKVSKKLRIKH